MDPDRLGLVPALAGRGAAYLVGLTWQHGSTEETERQLDELSALADTAGFTEAGRAALPLRHPNAATLIGRGQADDVGVLARGMGATVVIVDEDLAPAQTRNLEQIFDLPVVDRAGLIIDIFAQRARSKEARTQVEIAQLQYLLPRLAGRWSHLSRQVGGGPGGTKGEGEKQIELDRRMIRRRIEHLKHDLTRVDRSRGQRRKARRDVPEAALVGYTNVGKSSLFNAIVHGAAHVEDRLFATLDPTVRRFTLGRRGAFLLKDTVGFIRKLPHHLVASFRSTFEEAADADLLIIVVDMSHPDGLEQQTVAESVLAEHELSERPRLFVFNKIDLAPPATVDFLQRRYPEACLVSARTGEGIDQLIGRLGDRLLGREISFTLEIPPDRGDVLALAHRLAAIEHTVESGQGLRITLRGSERDQVQLQRALEEASS